MSAATQAKLQGFTRLIREWGVDFVYSGDSETYTGIPGDGYSSSLIPLVQIQPGEQFTVRFLRSAWPSGSAGLPQKFETLTADGTAYTIEDVGKVMPGDIILQLVCRLR